MVSVPLGFMLYAFIRQSEKLKKIDRSIWLIFCVLVVLEERFVTVYDCLSLCAFECLYVCVYIVARAYIYTYIWAYNSMHVYIYTHISAGWGKGRGCEKGRVCKEWGKNCFNQNDFFLLILLLFLIAKGLFDVNMKCLFCGKFYWMMMIKFKIIIMLLFHEWFFTMHTHTHTHTYIYVLEYTHQ